jgi:hypothetical protein
MSHSCFTIMNSDLQALSMPCCTFEAVTASAVAPLFGSFGPAGGNSSRDEGSVASEPGCRGVTDCWLFLSIAARKQISSIASSSAATNSLGRSADDPKHF